MTRPAIAIVAAIIAPLLIAPAAVDAQSSSIRDQAIKAARMLSDWRYDEARVSIGDLTKRAPKRVETRYLQGELEFIDGNYQEVLRIIEGIDDGAVGGNVGSLRSLATTTLEATKGFASAESSGGHFLVQYAPGVDEVIAELAAEVLEKAYTEIGADFDYFPKEKVRLEILAAPAELAKVSTLTEKDIQTTGTIALCKYGKLMVVSPRATYFGYPWMDTLVHEYVHYVVSRASHDRVPVWLHEGLAKFEQTRWRRGPSAKLIPTDESLLATAVRSARLISFDDMHPSMAKLPSQEAAALAFAEVFSMVGYVHAAVGYGGIRDAISRIRDGKTARRAVAEVMDTRWSKLERTWKRDLSRKNLKSDAVAASRTRHGIRFKRAGKESTRGTTENVGVDAVASEKARKHARLGGLLRARRMSKAAALEYEKALAAEPSDAFVAAKLSRTYLELRQYDKAADLAEPLLKIDENDASAATTLGLAHLATARRDEAIKAFEIALRVSPFDPAVRCGLADAYQASGDTTRAVREKKACATLR